VSDRLNKLTRKYVDLTDCSNGDMSMVQVSDRCLKSPALIDHSFQIPQMTKEDCSTTCTVFPTIFYGVENGQKCLCGIIVQTPEPGTCDIPCEGDSSEICGGTNSTLISTVVDHESCFSDDSVVLEGPTVHIDSLSHKLCKIQCGAQNYAFFGVQETNCSCGNYLRSAQPGICDTGCAGVKDENCGGTNAIRVLPVSP